MLGFLPFLETLHLTNKDYSKNSGVYIGVSPVLETFPLTFNPELETLDPKP